MMLESLRDLQCELKPWVKHNFGDCPAWQLLLGIMEEVGELAHAYVKQEQGIRNDEDHVENAQDAVGDIVVFLAAYCNAEGFDLAAIVAETWEKVQQRDWRATKRDDRPADSR